jgi:arginase
VSGWRLLGVPVDCSGIGRGEQRGPEALRAAGLPERLGAVDEGDLDVRMTDPTRDPTTGIVGYEQLRVASERIRDVVAELLRGDGVPLVLGGCCSILPGIAAGIARSGTSASVLYLDGHTDLYEPHRSATGEAADMPLALMCGFGPPGLTELGERAPLVAPAAVALVGNRDHEEWRGLGVTPPSELVPAMRIVDAPEALASDPRELGERLLADLEQRSEALWLHLDLDVLDERVFRAVTYPQPRGLGWHYLAELLAPALSSPKLIGMDITDLNADADVGLAQTRFLVEFLGDLLTHPGH